MLGLTPYLAQHLALETTFWPPVCVKAPNPEKESAVPAKPLPGGAVAAARLSDRIANLSGWPAGTHQRVSSTRRVDYNLDECNCRVNRKKSRS